MLRYLGLTACVVLSSTALGAQSKEQDRLIPQELLDKAECAIVIPSMTKVALGIGGSYGRGAMVCRSGETFNGPWVDVLQKRAPRNDSTTTTRR